METAWSKILNFMFCAGVGPAFPPCLIGLPRGFPGPRAANFGAVPHCPIHPMGAWRPCGAGAWGGGSATTIKNQRRQSFTRKCALQYSPTSTTPTWMAWRFIWLPCGLPWACLERTTTLVQHMGSGMCASIACTKYAVPQHQVWEMQCAFVVDFCLAACIPGAIPKKNLTPAAGGGSGLRPSQCVAGISTSKLVHVMNSVLTLVLHPLKF